MQSARTLALFLAVVGGGAAYLAACYLLLDKHLGILLLWDGHRLTTSMGLLALATVLSWSLIIECLGAVAAIGQTIDE